MGQQTLRQLTDRLRGESGASFLELLLLGILIALAAFAGMGLLEEAPVNHSNNVSTAIY